MKNVWKIMSTTALAAGLMVGCSSNEEVPVEDTAPVQEAETVETEDENLGQIVVPTLETEFTQEGNAVTISWNTDITVSAEHYGGEHVVGEGHAHVYVDGEKIAGLKNSEDYVVENLEAGEREIVISLQMNDHEPYEVSETFMAIVE